MLSSSERMAQRKRTQHAEMSPGCGETTLLSDHTVSGTATRVKRQVGKKERERAAAAAAATTTMLAVNVSRMARVVSPGPTRFTRSNHVLTRHPIVARNHVAAEWALHHSRISKMYRAEGKLVQPGYRSITVGGN